MAKRFTGFVLAAMLLAACSNDVLYEAYVDIPDESWSADSIAAFSLEVSDTLSSYTMQVNVRNSADYPFQNLYLFIDIDAPNGAHLRDTLQVFLADEKGNWRGKGSASLFDCRFLYRQNVRFSSSGIYRIAIQHAMRPHHLKGISAIGIRVERDNRTNR